MKIKLKYIWQDEDRHGNVRIYCALPGRPKVRLRAEPGTQAFLDDYHAAVSGVPLPSWKPAQPSPKVAPGSLRATVEAYYLSRDTFLTFETNTQYVKRRLLDALCLEPISDTDRRPIGELPFAQLTPKAIKALRDRRPTADGANGRLKAIKGLCAWALAEEIIDTNPARDVAYLATEGCVFRKNRTTISVIPGQQLH